MYIPDYKLEPKEKLPTEVTCSCCGDVVDERDYLFEYGGEHICSDCFLRKVFQEGVSDYVAYDPMLAINVADLIGVEYQRAEDYAA